MKTKLSKILLVASAVGAMVTTSAMAGSGKNCPMKNTAMNDRPETTYGIGGEQWGGISSNRSPRQGLGAADLARNDQRMHNPDGFAATDVFFQPDMQEPAGADRIHQHYDSETLQPIGATDADRSNRMNDDDQARMQNR